MALQPGTPRDLEEERNTARKGWRVNKKREWEDVSGGIKLRLCFGTFLDGWMTKRKERRADVAE